MPGKSCNLFEWFQCAAASDKAFLDGNHTSWIKDNANCWDCLVNSATAKNNNIQNLPLVGGSVTAANNVLGGNPVVPILSGANNLSDILSNITSGIPRYGLKIALFMLALMLLIVGLWVLGQPGGGKKV